MNIRTNIHKIDQIDQLDIVDVDVKIDVLNKSTTINDIEKNLKFDRAVFLNKIDELQQFCDTTSQAVDAGKVVIKDGKTQFLFYKKK